LSCPGRGHDTTITIEGVNDVSNHPTQHPVPPDPTSPQPVPTEPATVDHPASAQAQPAAAPSPRVESQPLPPEPEEVKSVSELKIYSHSSLVYWWPVWTVGYLMAILTYSLGQQYQIGQDSEWFHASSNLGVFYFLTLLLVILITNVSVRGLASGLVIMGAVLVSVLLAYFGWWDEIFGWFGGLRIHLSFGAYLWFSTVMLIVWAVCVFIVDRMSCWLIKSGQVTHEVAFGAGSKSYDTNGMMLEKHREDIFRHWLLGLGSGDIQIRTTGATKEQIDIPNVLLIGSKIEIMQRLIAEEPNAS
jgi:hypothetical protein